MVWLTEHRFVWEMYAFVRRMDLQILRSRHCLRLGGLLAASGGDPDRSKQTVGFSGC
jgi:hypothetical protein